MAQHIVIIGAGFAGLMAALSAARQRDEKGVSPGDLKITVIAPEPALIVRPRLYEPEPGTMVAPLDELFAATDIGFHEGWVDTLDVERGMVTVTGADGMPARLFYDRLIVAAGSQGFQPPIPGLSEFGHSVTDRAGAVKLDDLQLASALLDDIAFERMHRSDANGPVPARPQSGRHDGARIDERQDLRQGILARFSIISIEISISGHSDT